MEETNRLLENIMSPEDTLAIHFTYDHTVIQRIFHLGNIDSLQSVTVWQTSEVIDPITAASIMALILSLGSAKRFVTGSRIIIDERLCLVNLETLVDMLAKSGLIVDMVTHIAGFIILDKLTLLGTRR